MPRGRTHLLAMAIAFSLCGCGLAQDMATTQKSAEAAAAELQKELGTKPMIGWNVTNGALKKVNVVFPAEPVANLTVGELHDRVRRAVAHSFSKPPEQLAVTTYLAARS